VNIETMHIENFLMLCDITSHIDFLHGIVKHGRLHQFQWSDAPDGYAFERILRDRGIHTYGRMCQYYKEPGKDGKPEKHIRRWCWVNGEQAGFAEYNLLGAGVMLESGTVNEDNWKNFGKGAARPTWKEGGKVLKPTLLESISDWLAGLAR
jgi:hypothetical protein